MLQTMLGLTWQSKNICMQSQYAKWLQFTLCLIYIKSMISNRLNNHQNIYHVVNKWTCDDRRKFYAEWAYAYDSI